MNDRHSEDFWAGVYACVTILALSVIVSGLWLLTECIRSSLPEDDPVETYTQISVPVHIIEQKEVDPAQIREHIAAEPLPYFALTEAERDEMAQVIMCETGGVDEAAAELVALCVLNACEKDGIQPSDVFARYQYAQGDKTPNSTCYAAIQSVFDEGNALTEEPILFFYSPANMPNGTSAWHETQDFVLEYGGHRYFKLKGAEKNERRNQGNVFHQGSDGSARVGGVGRWGTADRYFEKCTSLRN